MKFFLFITLILSVSVHSETEYKTNLIPTCDFDLNDVDEMLDELPDLCREMYTNPTYKAAKESATAESKLYKRFSDTLYKHEKDCNEEKADYELRMKVHMMGEPNNCTAKGTEDKHLTEYYDCLTKRRTKMLDKLVELTKSCK